MNIFLVGGAVRDKLLGYPTHEKDWVVVGADAQDMLDRGFTPVGKDFPVFLHPKTKEEYALARTERKTAPGYSGFDFNTNKHVTLEQDLLRRDLTINAIAEDNCGNIIDPYGGSDDLKNKTLRHISPAFREDPVRILRIARFAARYHHLGFSIAPETNALMREMVAAGEVDALVPERVWKELNGALGERSPHIFIETLRACGALAILFPEIDRLFGIPQPKAHHPEIDTGVHVLMVLAEASRLSDAKTVRFAALVHDLGKGLTDPQNWPKHHGHEKLGLAALNQLCERTKVPNDYRELAELVMEYHTHVHRAYELKASTILKLFKRVDIFRKPERFASLLISCKADAQGRAGLENRNYTQANYLATAAMLAKSVSVQQFIDSGLQGKAIADALDKARLHAISGLVNANRTELTDASKT